MRSGGIHLRAILQEIPQPSVTEVSLKITNLRFCSNLPGPGANEVTHCGLLAVMPWSGGGIGQHSLKFLLEGLIDKKSAQIARVMGPTWGPPGADRSQVGLMYAPWTLLSGSIYLGNDFMPYWWQATTWTLCTAWYRTWPTLIQLWF